MEEKNKISEEVKKRVSDYLYKSSNHLFLRRYEYEKEYKCYYRVIPIVLNGKLHYVILTVGDGEMKVTNIGSTDWVTTRKDLGEFKDIIFPKYYKHKSVKQYKGVDRKYMYSKVWDIKKFVKDNPNMDVKELKTALNKLVSNFKVEVEKREKYENKE